MTVTEPFPFKAADHPPDLPFDSRRIRMAADHAELVAANSVHAACAVEGILNNGGHVPQRRIAVIMAIRVVDRFKVVDIHDDDRQMSMAGQSADRLFIGRTIQKAGQGVQAVIEFR